MENYSTSFRAWDTVEKKWAYYHAPQDFFKCHDSDSHPITRYKHWGQKTGMVDRKGKDIYQDDIVMVEGFGKYKVVYFKESMKFYFMTMTKNANPFVAHASAITIVGTIYDKPKAKAAKKKKKK